MTRLKATALFVYPVKGMKGITLKETQLTTRGLLHDRRWMVVREDGSFVTQRDSPRLALINTSLDEEGVSLTLAGHGSVTVPFELFRGAQIETRVWRVDCQAVDQGAHISEWLTQALESDVTLRLVRMAPEFKRAQNRPDIMGAETTVDFADAAPFLVANQASLDRLNAELSSQSMRTVPIDQFRPNIVVQGLEPFAEHDLGGLTTSEFQFRFRTPCERCIVTTINQKSAEKDPFGEPFKTLRAINPMPGNPRAPAFGQYATLEGHQPRVIRVGDQFEPIAVSAF